MFEIFLCADQGPADQRAAHISLYRGDFGALLDISVRFHQWPLLKHEFCDFIVFVLLFGHDDFRSGRLLVRFILQVKEFFAITVFRCSEAFLTFEIISHFHRRRPFGENSLLAGVTSLD